MSAYFDYLMESLNTSALDISINPTPREVAQMFIKSTVYRSGDRSGRTAALRGVRDDEGNYYVADAYAGVHLNLIHRLGKTGARFSDDTHFIIYGNGKPSTLPYFERGAEDEMLSSYGIALDKAMERAARQTA